MAISPKASATFRAKVGNAMQALRDEFGLDAESAAAIMGNAGHESGGLEKLQEIKPTVAGSRGGYGWFQWTGSRRRAFEKWCKDDGLKPSDDVANLGFLIYELKTSEKKAIPAVKAASGLDAKVRAFEAAYERAGVKSYPARLEWANLALTSYQGKSAMTSKPKAQWAEDTLAPFEVESIQKRLRDLGWFQVGKVDGKWGPSTAGAIMALQAQVGITADGHYGPETKAALADDKNQRKVDPKRAATTASDLRAQGSIIAIQGQRVTWASVGTIVIAAFGVAQYFFTNYDPSAALPFPFSMVSSFLPPWVAMAAPVVLNLYNALAAKGIVGARVSAERTGLHNGEPDPAPSPPVTQAPDSENPAGFFGKLFGH